MHVQSRRGHLPKSYKPHEPSKPKLYLVTRRDLEPAQQAVQAAHALRQFVAEQPAADKAWFEGSNTLALLAVDTERKLRGLLDVAQFMGVPCAAFHEPDMGSALTAIALGPCTEARRLTRRLGPAMSQVG